MSKEKFAEIKTPLGGKLLLRGMNGIEELGRPFSYHVELLSEDEAIAAASLLGQGMTIKLSLPDESERCIHGLCTSFVAVGKVGRYALYEAELRPWIWLLSHTSDCRIFQNETIPDIIKKVFRDHGFSDVEDALTETYKPLEYVVQYRETALNFVTRLMEKAGIYYFFEHADGKHSLVLADSQAAHKTAKGCEQVSYYPPEQRHARDQDHFDEWRMREQFRTGKYTINDYDFKRPSADLLAKSALPRNHASPDFELYDYPGEYSELSDGETAAKVRMQAHQARYEQITGGGNVRGLNAGCLFTLKNFARADQNRQYLLVSLTSHLEIKEYESRSGGQGSSYRISTVVVDSKTDYRLPFQTEKPLVMGPQTAIVTGKEGDEIWTDEFGRVKLKFHWDREGKADENSSCWVRVAQVWAGSGWGSVHIPRVGQEVIVEFLEGDPDRPLVTGCVYNGSNKPPHELPENAAWSGFKSRSTKGGNPDEGNEIRFEDERHREELFVRAQRNYKEVVNHDHTVRIHRDQSVTIDGSQSVIIKGGHALGASPGAQLAIDGQYEIGTSGKIVVGSDVSITIHCGIQSKIEMDGMSIKLSVGGSEIVIDPTCIKLNAPQVKLNSL